jgi:hypothetical protein
MQENSIDRGQLEQKVRMLRACNNAACWSSLIHREMFADDFFDFIIH